MPGVKKEIRYKVTKNRKTTHHKTKRAANKRANGTTHRVCHRRHKPVV